MAGKAKYTKNDNYFKELSKQSSYWAGFIAADGNIHKRRTMLLELSLSSKDKEHLERFVSDIEWSGPIAEYQNRTVARAAIHSSSEICKDLEDIYNIGPKKTFSLQPPNLDILPKENIIPYIIGFLDGDGFISLIKGRYPRVSVLCASKDFLEWVRINLNPLCGKEYLLGRRGKHFTLNYTGVWAANMLKILNKEKVYFMPRKISLAINKIKDIYYLGDGNVQSL